MYFQLDETNLNWGDVPAWVLVFVSFLGVIAAFVAGVYAALIYRIERNRDLVSQDQRDRSQATLISAWAIYSSDVPNAQAGNIQLLAEVNNASAQPIYGVTIFWYLDGRNIYQDKVGMVPPRRPGEPGFLFEVPLGVFQGNYAVVAGRSGMRFNEAKEIIKKTRFRMIFTDLEGIEWERSERGSLVRL